MQASLYHAITSDQPIWEVVHEVPGYAQREISAAPSYKYRAFL